jgi:predicted methyltransferase
MTSFRSIIALRSVGLAAAVALVAVPACKSKAKDAPKSDVTKPGSGAVAVTPGPGSAPGSAVAAAPASLITKAQSPTEAMNDATRTADDKALDAGRQPAALLDYLHVAAGMKVAEIFAGGGYTVEMLARVVGPTGKVYGQNTPEILAKFAEKPWSDRLARLASPNIVRLDTELAGAFPADVTGLDLVVMHLVYHDTVWMGADRSGMNSSAWKALKPGGEFAIIDHSAKDGTGADAAKDLHRIDMKYVQDEVEQTGFKLDRQSDMFKHPEDTRDWNAAPGAAADKRGQSDRFVLVFKKPLDAK